MSQAKEPSLSLADQVAIELREDIIGGRLLPGMPLVESELVNAYNASRNTVREALHHLGREGLTSYVRNKGVIVRRLGWRKCVTSSRCDAPWSCRPSPPASRCANTSPT